MTVLDVFELQREGEAKIFNPLDLDNHKLLWHGSRFSNFVGILSQGMRIAPPEAPKSGYAYGKGAYFADCIAKSGSYTCHHLSNGIGLLLLCQVALGTPTVRNSSDQNVDDFVKKSKGKYHSCFAKGGRFPNPEEDIVVQRKDGNDYTVPSGPVITSQSNNSGGFGGSWGYNEFIVYETNQIMMRYLVKVKFN